MYLCKWHAHIYVNCALENLTQFICNKCAPYAHYRGRRSNPFSRAYNRTVFYIYAAHDTYITVPIYIINSARVYVSLFL